MILAMSSTEKRASHTSPQAAGQPSLVDPPERAIFEGQSEDLLSDRLARQIRISILRGDNPAGSRLNLDEMKGRYDVSLSPLREALSRLTAEGFVRFEAKRGFRVSEMSGANLGEITTIRRLCEPVAIRESVLHGDDDWEERVAAAAHMLGKRVAAEPSPISAAEWESAHRKFHLAVLSGCGMPMLMHFCSTLMDLQDRYRLQLAKGGAYSRRADGKHLALLDACLTRNAKLAEKLALEHIDRTHQELIAAMSGTPLPVAKPRAGARRRKS
ncbi:GntR family carbon starvation induced transcriptional regulator [Variovorax sp. W1I1]|uniref:GntR family transcriptional regulator n=1 Tax=Variovorax sp. W1I1 TaxID=3042309 RepID=UPI0027816E9C|nr:GntR family transcriptional regulator [Variovorax sp. W1I1]MDQ0610906.1 GntR family carbon starvation induced transcriptional regulator [Variovorax sp. W1I1]